jgi:hypothetical protein
MTITLPLEPQKQPNLIAVVESNGMTADELASHAIDAIIRGARGRPLKEPTHSLRGLLAKYGPAPSAEEIEQNQAEMLANFPRTDF